MNALVFRFSVGLVGSLCFTACTPLLGDFEDCATNVDCWETYERSDLICRDRQCVVHELHEKCTTVIGDNSADKDDSDLITFGAIMTMTDADTGEPSPRGEHRSKALDLAYRHFNQWGGIEGKSLRVRICDHQKDSERVEDLAKYLLEDRQLPLVITGGSSDTINASAVAIPAGAAVISISATALGISNLDDEGLVWRVVPSDAQIGAAVANAIGASAGGSAVEAPVSVGVLYINDPFGQGLQSEFKKEFQEQQPQATVYAAPFEDGEAESIRAALATLNDQAPQSLFVIAFATDAALIANEIGGDNYPNLPRRCNLYFTNSMKDQSFLDGLNSTAPSALEGASIAAWGAFGDVYDNFRSEFETTYDLDPNDQGYLAHSYDLGFVTSLAALHAVHVSGALNGQGLAEGMRHLGAGASFDFTNANVSAMVEAMKNDGSVDVNGATGPLDFDPALGEPMTGQIIKSFISGGTFSDERPDGSVCDYE